jgi:hypothetical protein
MRSFHSPSSSAHWRGADVLAGAEPVTNGQRAALRCVPRAQLRGSDVRCALRGARGHQPVELVAGTVLRLRCRNEETARVMIDDHAHAQDSEDRSLHRKLPGSPKTHRTRTFALILCFTLFISTMVTNGALPAEHRSELIIDTPA